jgi:hypothetical protein
MVFNATFNNIAVISWRWVLLVLEAVFWLDNQCELFLNSTLDNGWLYLATGAMSVSNDFPQGLYLWHRCSHPISDIKEKHTQIQYNNNKMYSVTLYLHCQTWPCWQQTTAQVYFKGGKSWKKYISGEDNNRIVSSIVNTMLYVLHYTFKIFFGIENEKNIVNTRRVVSIRKFNSPMWNNAYNYLCNRCLSPLIMWVRIPLSARCATLCDKVC